MADVAADIDRKVTADGTGGGGQGVGGSEENCAERLVSRMSRSCLGTGINIPSNYALLSEGGLVRTTASLDGVTALPDHGADGAAHHVCPAVSATSGGLGVGCN